MAPCRVEGMTSFPRMLARCMLFAAAMAASFDDPLAQWLDSLKFSLQDVTQEKAGITFKVSNLVCQNLQLSDIKSAVEDVGMSIKLEGIGIVCNGHFDYHGLAIVSGSGDLQAVVKSSPSSTATVALHGTNMAQNLPWAVEATSCDANLDLKLTLSGSIIYDVINIFKTPVSALIKHQAIAQACTQLKTMAAGQLSQKLADFNRLMLPSDDGELLLKSTGLAAKPEAGAPWFHVDMESFEDFVEDVANGDHGDRPKAEENDAGSQGNLFLAERRLKAVSKDGTVDWTHDETLKWISWLVDDVIGPERLDQAVSWAVKGNETVIIPGPANPLMTTTVKQPDAGLELRVTAFLKSASIEGADGMSDFSPVAAVGPNDLRFKVSWGTAKRPAFGLGVDVKVQVEAVDLSSGKSQAAMEQEMSLHLAVLSPSLEVQGEVQVLAREWPGTRSLAQLMVALKQCLTSMLKQAPLLKSVQMKFQQLAAPLSFVTRTQGALENALANLLNNGVGLFNQVYQPLLPGAIQRFAGSQKLIQTVNNQLSQQMKPQTCIDPALASQQVRNVFPQYYGDWPPVFGNWARQLIDSFFDGFIASNTSVLEDFGAMPKVPLPLDGKVALRQLIATGLDQVSQLRVALPTADHPSWLENKAVAKCPTDQAPWRPTFAVNGSLVAGNFGGDGLVSLEMPCGTLDAEVDVVVDFWHLMDLQIPPTMTCAMMSPLAKLDIKKVNATWGGSGRVKVQPKDGPAQYPVDQMCTLHPDACKLADEMREFVSSTEGATRLYHMARDKVLSKCTSPQLSAEQEEGLQKDQQGYTYVEPDDYKVWLGSAVVILALAATYTFAATLGRLVKPDTCESADLSPTSSLPLATICWYGTPASRSVGGIPKISTFVASTLMAAGLVARILACFWLPFASAGVSLEQKTGGTIFKDETLLQYTFFGIGEQFYLGGSLYCQILWFFMSLVSALTCHAILLLVWLTPFLASHRRKLLMAALVLGRFALSEAETTGNTAMVLGNAVPMPLGMVQKMSLGLEAGAYTSWFATACTVFANLLLLKILPRPVAPKEWASGEAPRFITIVQAVNSVMMVAGICVWYFCDFMHAETGGIAGALIPPANYSGSGLGKSDLGLHIFIILTAGVCPLMHIVAFVLGWTGKAPKVARGLAAVATSFCLLDLFTIGYLATFLEGVNGFASSAVHDFAKPLCELSQEALGKDCLTMTASVVPLGTVGLLVATAAWSALAAVQVLGFGQKRMAGEVTPLQAELRAAEPPSFQECDARA